MFGWILKFIFFGSAFCLLFIGLWIKLIPGTQITPIFKGTILEKIACSYPVKISGQSMAPIFEENKYVFFNKCIVDKSNLDLNTVVLFNQNSLLRIAIIRDIDTKETGLFYKVSPQARFNDFSWVRPDEIVATWEEEI